METTSLPSVISNSGLVSCKISSPTDIYNAARRFGDDFLQMVFCRYQKPVDIEKAVSSGSPTFHDVTDFWSESATLFWLRFHIAETFAFLGIYDTASVFQVRATAELIIQHEIFGQLTLDEFLYFLQRFKQGRYGKIFQSARPNPQEFLMCLEPFWNEISRERGRAKDRERQQQISADAHHIEKITYEQWLAEKRQAGEETNTNTNPLNLQKQ